MSLVGAQLQFAQHFSCDANVCESQQHPAHHLPARLRTDREFGDTAAIDLFVLVSFIDILDLASTSGVVAMIPSKHPKIVWEPLFQTLDHSFWRTAKVDLRPRRRIRTRVRIRARRSGVANPCRQQPLLHSKTQSVNGMEESGKYMRVDCLMSSASNLCLNSCIV